VAEEAFARDAKNFVLRAKTAARQALDELPERFAEVGLDRDL
jgi:hypothetical protein